MGLERTLSKCSTYCGAEGVIFLGKLSLITKKGQAKREQALASVLFGQEGEWGFTLLFRDFGSVLRGMLWRPEKFYQNSETSDSDSQQFRLACV